MTTWAQHRALSSTLFTHWEQHSSEDTDASADSFFLTPAFLLGLKLGLTSSCTHWGTSPWSRSCSRCRRSRRRRRWSRSSPRRPRPIGSAAPGSTRAAEAARRCTRPPLLAKEGARVEEIVMSKGKVWWLSAGWVNHKLKMSKHEVWWLGAGWVKCSKWVRMNWDD